MANFLKLVIPWLLSVILGIVATTIAYSLLAEMGIRLAFSPIAMADVYGEGLRSPGMRYFKRYMAVFMKIGVSLFVCILSAELIGELAKGDLSQLSEFFKFFFGLIACQLMTVGLIMKAGEYANDILGAN